MIATYFRGRLGNNMYQYSHIRSVAERKNYDFSIMPSASDSFNQFDDIFPHLKFDRTNIYQIRKEVHKDSSEIDRKYDKIGTVWEEYNYDFKKQFYDLPDNVTCFGFFQNYQYSNREDVKKWFQIYLNDEQQEEYDRLYDLYDPEEYCYIHFRGTDFLKVPLYITKIDFWKNAQNKIIDNYGKKKFLVITDDIENAKLNINAENYIAPNFKIGLKMMTKSNQLIIPSWTTFVWWGGWLSDASIIIAPDINNICYAKNDVFTYI